MSNTFDNYPAKYLLYNQQLSKNLTIVMEIEGLDVLYGVAETFTQVAYGDPNIVYGEPGLVYGGLRSVGNLMPYIILDSSFTIQQRIEPEQGKGNVGTINLTLIDYNGQVSKIIAPGVVLSEILYKPQFRIWIGFAQTSFPDDFVLLFQGYCTQTNCPPGVVQFQLSDSTSLIRQPLFNTQITYLTADINDNPTTTTIPVVSTAGFYTPILGPNGEFDPTVFTYIVIDQEIMLVNSVNATNFFVTRAQLGSVISSHTTTTEVDNTILLGAQSGSNSVHFIDLCLKLMLSGWDGDSDTGILLGNFNYIDPTLLFQPSAFTLASQDAIRDLGFSVGDQFTITGAANSQNNVTGFITGFGDSTITNQVIYTDQIFVVEPQTAALGAFRSQYDTLPIGAGLMMRMRDVDVAGWQNVKSTYFSSGINNISIYYNAAQTGLDTIDSDILLPMGCYGISRFGRASIGVTKPPLPGVGKLVSLDWTNVINPQQIIVSRSTNSRTFYNLISYNYNFDIPSGNYTSVQYFLDTVSLNQFAGVEVQLPINAPGLRDELGGATVAQSRGTALLTRYKTVAILITLTVNWSAGSTIEVCDVVKLTDNGTLQIMNFETGERNIGVQLYEVIQRSYNVMAGNVTLTLMGGLGFNVNSRFGLYSPSSILNSGCTETSLILTPSYGQQTITEELLKWSPYVGQPIQVHNFDYSVTGSSFINSLNGNTLMLSPALGFIPPSGYILDIPSYPTDDNANEQANYKLLYAHYSPSVPISGGILTTSSFDVNPSYVDEFTIGNTIILRNSDYSSLSQEVAVVGITGNVVQAASPFIDQDSFEPFPIGATGYIVEGIGFKDGTSFYRYG